MRRTIQLLGISGAKSIGVQILGVSARYFFLVFDHDLRPLICVSPVNSRDALQTLHGLNWTMVNGGLDSPLTCDVMTCDVTAEHPNTLV